MKSQKHLRSRRSDLRTRACALGQRHRGRWHGGHGAGRRQGADTAGSEGRETHAGWITAGHVARGKCSARSGQGALDVATHHRWAGSFSNSLGSYFITTILGEADNGPRYYWSIFINNRSASTGACEIKLHNGDQLAVCGGHVPGVSDRDRSAELGDSRPPVQGDDRLVRRRGQAQAARRCQGHREWRRWRGTPRTESPR